jgi:hypothetical protein
MTTNQLSYQAVNSYKDTAGTRYAKRHPNPFLHADGRSPTPQRSAQWKVKPDCCTARGRKNTAICDRKWLQLAVFIEFSLLGDSPTTSGYCRNSDKDWVKRRSERQGIERDQCGKQLNRTAEGSLSTLVQWTRPPHWQQVALSSDVTHERTIFVALGHHHQRVTQDVRNALPQASTALRAVHQTLFRGQRESHCWGK